MKEREQDIIEKAEMIAENRITEIVRESYKRSQGCGCSQCRRAFLADLEWATSPKWIYERSNT